MKWKCIWTKYFEGMSMYMICEGVGTYQIISHGEITRSLFIVINYIAFSEFVTLVNSHWCTAKISWHCLCVIIVVFLPDASETCSVLFIFSICHKSLQKYLQRFISYCFLFSLIFQQTRRNADMAWKKKSFEKLGLKWTFNLISWKLDDELM